MVRDAVRSAVLLLALAGPASAQYSATYWRLRVDASAGGLSAQHRYAAVHPAALDGADPYDVADMNSESPPYILTYFVIGASRYVQDMRQTPPPLGPKTWTLYVKTSLVGSTVTLTFPNGADLPASWVFQLTDPDAGTTIPIAAGTTYSYVQAATTKTLTIDAERLAVPAIALSPSDLAFTAVAGGANPAAQTLTVTNTGDAGSTLSFTMGDPVGWLSETPASGSLAAGASASVSVGVDITGLSPGSYAAVITVADPAASNTPQTVNVSLLVEAPPTIELNPTSLSFSGTQGGVNPPGQSITLTNGGGLTLNYAVSDNAPWLQLNPASGVLAGGAATSLVAGVDLVGLAAGAYTATVTVSDPAASNSPQSVAVTLTVSPPGATINLSPPSISFAGTIGGPNPAAQTLTVTNVGTTGSTLAYAVADDAAWLAFSPAGGALTSGASDALALTADITGLAAGTYAAMISVSDATATNSPQTAGVTLVVNPPGATMALSSSSFAFTGAVGGPNPAAQTLTVTNIGTAGSTLAFTVADTASWLEALPTGGSLSSGASASITLTASLAGLSAGTYTATISASDPTATNSPQGAAATITVTSTPLSPTALAVTDIALGAPRFGARFEHTDAGAKANRHRIQVATSEAALLAEAGLLWDETGTGVPFSPETPAGSSTVGLAYTGAPLAWGLAYWWRIRLWDTAGAPSPWSAVAGFTMPQPQGSPAAGTAGSPREVLVAVPHGGPAALATSFVGGYAGTWERWDEATGAYQAVAELEPGRGYRISTTGGMLTLLGGTAAREAVTWLNLTVAGTGDAAGLHLLGNPFNGVLDWNLAGRAGVRSVFWVIEHLASGQRVARWYGPSPIGDGGVSELWSAVTGQGGWAGNRIPAFRGFFVRATSPANSVTLQPPTSLSAPPPPPAEFNADYWRLRLDVRVGDLEARHRYAAVYGGADDGRDDYDVEDLTPAAADFLGAYFAIGEARFAQDVRRAPPSNMTLAWELRIETSRAGSPVEVSFPNAADLPASWTYLLQDPSTGASLSISAGASYSFVAPSGTRILEVRAQRTGSAGARLYVSAAADMPGPSTVSAGSRVEMLRVDVRAESQDVEVYALQVRSSGTGDDDADVATVRLRTADGTTIGEGRYAEDNGGYAWALSRVIAAGTTEQWVVEYDLGSPAEGSTFSASVDPPVDVAGVAWPTGATVTATGAFIQGPEMTAAEKAPASGGSVSGGGGGGGGCASGVRRLNGAMATACLVLGFVALAHGVRRRVVCRRRPAGGRLGR